MKHHRSLFLFSVVWSFFFLSLSSCTPSGTGNDSAALYDEAARLEHRKRYSEALESYNKALAADTLKGFSPKAMDALCRKNHIENLMGRYADAFRTCGSIKDHATPALSDSLHGAALSGTAEMYAELGLYGKAASLYAELRNPDGWQRFRQATFLFRSGDPDGASSLFSGLSLSTDPSVRMAALAGLLECSLSAPGVASETPERYAEKIAAVSAEVLKAPGSPETKIRALRIAARCMGKLEKQRPNASYLLFRALALAEEAGLSALVPVLQFESNNLIVRKPDTWRSVIEYFGQKNMPHQKAAALCMLGQSPELSPAERIDVLKSALAACQNYGIPATAKEYVSMMKEASAQLSELLIAEGRYVELFDFTAQAELLEQRTRLQSDIAAFRLPAGHESLQNEIIGLSREIAGLLQRKISMVEEGSGFRFATMTDQVIAQKQGRLIELIAEASNIDDSVQARLQPEALTLRTIQKSLRPDQALFRIFNRESNTIVMLVSSREMQIVTSEISADEIRRGFSALKQRLNVEKWSLSGLVSDPQRMMLTESLLQSMSEHLMAYRHIIYVSATPEPYHLLGRNGMPGRDRQVSWLLSSNELRLETRRLPGGDMVWYDAATPEKAQLHRWFHPEDMVFLFWSPLSEQDVALLKAQLKKRTVPPESGSAFLSQLASGGAADASRAWVWLGSYGSH